MAKKTTTAASPTCTSSPLKSLGANPIFHLSLSSKELFHSNFLVWLADYQTALFNEILAGCFGCTTFKYDPAQYVALREYKNFDFCICERDAALVDGIGRIVFLLENKFKSIPYKVQLDEYVQKAAEYNFECWKVSFKGSKGIKRLTKKLIQDHYNDPINECTFEQWDNYIKDKSIKPPYNPHFVLLTLAKEFLDKKDIEDEGIWKIVTYRDYAGALHVPAGSTAFADQLIDSYKDFISTFSSYCSTKLSVPTNWNDVVSGDACLESLRMNDVWKKLLMQVVAEEVRDKITTSRTIITQNKSDKDLFDLKDPFIYIGVGYSNGNAILDIKLSVDKDKMYAIQLQGKDYRYAVITKAGSGTALTWLNDFLAIMGKPGVTSMNQFAGPYTFYYTKENLTGKATSDVINKILDDLRCFL